MKSETLIPGKLRVPGEPYRALHWVRVAARRSPSTHDYEGRRFYRFYLARNALLHGLRALGLTEGDEVLVPAFICKVVTEAIEACGAKPVLFDVRLDCTVDASLMKTKISERTRALLAVHHFGYCRDVADLQQFCRSHDLYLIEDCAHVFVGEDAYQNIGSHGDIAIFSWRKFLAIHDGGTLVINNPVLQPPIRMGRASAISSLLAAKSLLDRSFESGSARGLRRLVEATRDAIPRFRRNVDSTNIPSGAVSKIDGTTFDPALANMPMTTLSRLLATHSAINEIQERRYRNYVMLAEGLAGMSAVTLLRGQVEPDVSPWMLAFRVKGVNDARLMYRRHGIPASHWGTVRPAEVNASNFPVADRLFRELIFLPVHQDLRPHHVDEILEVSRVIIEPETSCASSLVTQRVPF